MMDWMEQGLMHLPGQSVSSEVRDERGSRGQAAILGVLEDRSKGDLLWPSHGVGLEEWEMTSRVNAGAVPGSRHLLRHPGDYGTWPGAVSRFVEKRVARPATPGSARPPGRSTWCW